MKSKKYASSGNWIKIRIFGDLDYAGCNHRQGFLRIFDFTYEKLEISRTNLPSFPPALSIEGLQIPINQDRFIGDEQACILCGSSSYAVPDRSPAQPDSTTKPRRERPAA